jgi:hypothetical protein
MVIVPFMDRIDLGVCGCLCDVRMWDRLRLCATDSRTGCCLDTHRKLIGP